MPVVLEAGLSNDLVVIFRELKNGVTLKCKKSFVIPISKIAMTFGVYLKSEIN